MEKCVGMRKVRVASDRLNQCQQVSKSVCETAGWFEKSWSKRVSGDLSLFSTASLVHSSFFRNCGHVRRGKDSDPSLFHLTEERQRRCPLSISALNPKTPLPLSVSLFPQLIWAYLLWFLCLIASWIAKLCRYYPGICQNAFISNKPSARN